ncbi:aminotransferase class I/II-fold pyridoxal phosphate-dependent enzyme, partial [Vibrio parahaemolyticus]
FPLKTWRRLVQKHLSHGAGSRFASADDPAGAPELRAAIAAHQGAARGLSVDASQVIITGGRTEALNLIARLILS